MSKTGIYENLPLKPLKHASCETQSLLRHPKPTFVLPTTKPYKRKSTPEAFVSAREAGTRPKQSKSASDVLLQGMESQQQEGGAKSSSSETLKAASEEGEEMRSGQRKGTPTSILDDGYESCNSTPHGSSGKLDHNSFIVIRNFSINLDFQVERIDFFLQIDLVTRWL